MSVEIREVTTEAELVQFVRFPFELFKNHPYWVGELQRDTLALLRENNAFWQHAVRKLFLA